VQVRVVSYLTREKLKRRGLEKGISVLMKTRRLLNVGILSH
jgi:hypothetical protein